MVERAADDPLALWSPLRTHSLRLRLGEKTTGTDLDGHIRDWLSSLTETVPGDAEEVASVTGPSRDLRFAAVQMAHHFTAVTNLADRPLSADDSFHEQPSQGVLGLWTRQATLEDLPAPGYLCSMFVDPAARGRGGGRLLAEAAHRCAVDRGWTALLLHHAVANPWSVPFGPGRDTAHC